MLKTVAIIQARMGSSRLPGKVLSKLGDISVLEWVIGGCKAIKEVDDVIVATTTKAEDDAVFDWCNTNNLFCFRGDENDVLKRYYEAAENVGADVILRITADCPFLDPSVCYTVLNLFKRDVLDYASNTEPATWPDGLDCEIFTFQSLKIANSSAKKKHDREHVTTYIKNNKQLFATGNITCPLPGLSEERWTLDTQDDLLYLQEVVSKLPETFIKFPKERSYLDILSVLRTSPDINSLKDTTRRNQGSEISLNDYKKNVSFQHDYEKSWDLFESVSKNIPMATQTFSKAYTQVPNKYGPLFITHGRGAYVWDVDGNKYIDLVSGLMPIVLGYCDSGVDESIKKQLNLGISFSLASPIEDELAKRLIELIPCAEMVRFGKNGSDATSAAIRLARSYTGRDRVAVCGYHGWQDWYIGSTSRNKGVPNSVRELTHKFNYNDIESLKELFDTYKNEFAAVILEPVNFEMPIEGFLEELITISHDCGAVVIFDEIITGFRVDLGGAQTYYNVTPDLACFGKAMANGMPISAVVGKKDIMNHMEEVFVSSTFGGETLSIAAAIAVIDKMKSEKVIESLWENGKILIDGIKRIIHKYNLADIISVKGLPVRSIIHFQQYNEIPSDIIMTYFKKEMYAKGILIGNTNAISYAHDEHIIQKVLTAYEYTLNEISTELKNNTIIESLNCESIKPVFQIRK